jgi:hypothetical protein
MIIEKATQFTFRGTDGIPQELPIAVSREFLGADDVVNRDFGP